MLWQQKRTQLPILNIDFAIENKTRTKQTKHSVTGAFVLILTWTPCSQARNRPCQCFLKSSFRCARFSFVGLNRTRNFHFFFTTWVRCITTHGRACITRKSLLKVGIHRYRTLFQEYFNADWYQSMAHFKNKIRALKGPKKPTFKFLEFFFYRNRFVHMIS